jgi:hypothetical protein
MEMELKIKVDPDLIRALDQFSEAVRTLKQISDTPFPTAIDNLPPWGQIQPLQTVGLATPAFQHNGDKGCDPECGRPPNMICACAAGHCKWPLANEHGVSESNP